MQEYITKQEAVKIANKSIHTINKLVSSGKVTSKKDGRITKILLTSLYSVYPELEKEKEVKASNITNNNTSKLLEKTISMLELQLTKTAEEKQEFKNKLETVTLYLDTSKEEKEKLKNSLETALSKQKRITSILLVSLLTLMLFLILLLFYTKIF